MPPDAFLKLSAPETGQFWKIPVLGEDARMMALDKPARLLTSPDRYDPQRPSLMRLLHREIARVAGWARERRLTYLANVHRLDFDTSGVLLLAKDKAALIALANQFGSRRPVKRYVALVHGSPERDTWETDAPLGPHPTRPGLMRVDSRRGKPARTVFEVAERYTDFFLVRCLLFTGRTHQIRVHLKQGGYPIVGDPLYGGRPLLLSRLKPGYRFKKNQPERPLMDRTALHAAELTVQHPDTGAAVTFDAPWPKDLAVAVKYLRLFADPRARGEGRGVRD